MQFSTRAVPLLGFGQFKASPNVTLLAHGARGLRPTSGMGGIASGDIFEAEYTKRISRG